MCVNQFGFKVFIYDAQVDYSFCLSFFMTQFILSVIPILLKQRNISGWKSLSLLRRIKYIFMRNSIKQSKILGNEQWTGIPSSVYSLDYCVDKTNILQFIHFIVCNYFEGQSYSFFRLLDVRWENTLHGIGLQLTCITLNSIYSSPGSVFPISILQ